MLSKLTIAQAILRHETERLERMQALLYRERRYGGSRESVSCYERGVCCALEFVWYAQKAVEAEAA